MTAFRAADRLTEVEVDSLTECECGHFANEHSSDGCLAADFSDFSGLCICTHSPQAINRHAIERIVEARVAAERDAVLAKVDALHKPFYICDDCDHDHTDADVREGRAFDTGYSYTCTDALLYIACEHYCMTGSEQTADCATYHEHTKHLADRCPTARLVADLRAGVTE